MSAKQDLFANPRPVHALADLLANVWQLGYVTTDIDRASTVLIPDRVRAGYVDTTAELGHWLEICQLQREDIDFFSALVSDSA